jgi:4-amino-4-deoxy-L-arabinose transferase-like glycosyltransferase
MIIFMWMLVTGEWRLFSSMHLASGIVVFLLITAPWHLLVQRANPEFFDFYFVREHFQRYLTKVHHHYKPFWFFGPISLLGLFPWSVFLVQAVKQNLPASWKDRHQHKDALFLMLWAGLIFLFFSASSSKLIPYILPVLPPLAILIGKYLADAWEMPIPGGVRIGEILFSLFCMLFAIAMIVLPRYRPEASSMEVTVLRYILVLVFLVGGGIALTGRRGPVVRNAVIPIIITVTLFYTAGGAIVPPLDDRSLKPLALAIKPLLRPGDEIAHYRNYFQDMPVYLERRMTIVEWKGELNFGTTIEDTSDWMISEAELWKRWQGPTRIFLVATQKEFAEFRKIPGRAVFPVAQKKNTVILSNIEVK